MANDLKVWVSLRRSTIEMIRGCQPSARTLDAAIEEMILAKPPKQLLNELDRRERGRYVSRTEARGTHGY